MSGWQCLDPSNVWIAVCLLDFDSSLVSCVYAFTLSELCNDLDGIHWESPRFSDGRKPLLAHASREVHPEGQQGVYHMPCQLICVNAKTMTTSISQSGGWVGKWDAVQCPTSFPGMV